eukprot:3002886-Amphidinium_carterae.1
MIIARKPATYLHLAGRVGRLGQEGGKVISIVPKRSVKVGRHNRSSPSLLALEEECRVARMGSSESVHGAAAA